MSPVLIVLLSILFLIILVLILPVHLLIKVENESLNIFVRVLFFKFSLYPVKQKKKVVKKKQEKPKTKKPKKTKEEKQEKMSFEEIIKYITGLTKVLIKKSLKNIWIKLINYDIEVGTDDAAKTAILYGTINALSSNLLALLKTYAHFKISKNVKGVYTNFISEQIKANLTIDFSTNVVKALAILLPTAIQYIKIKQEIVKGENQNG